MWRKCATAGGTLRAVADHEGRDEEREVEAGDDELPVLPDQTSGDTDAGWGERRDSNDDRLRHERPPHWD